MTSEYTHRNTSYENRFVEAQTSDYKNPMRQINPLPNPIYKHPLQYYDSPVKNSSLYPNMYEIKPVDYNYMPTNIGELIDKSIEERKQFVFGGYVLPIRQYNYKS